jgi:hypothetical protein
MSHEFDKYINQQYKKVEKFFPHKTPQTVNEWEDVAHEMAWAIGIVEEEPYRIKSWNRLFNVMKRYEELCRKSER